MSRSRHTLLAEVFSLLTAVSIVPLILLVFVSCAAFAPAFTGSAKNLLASVNKSRQQELENRFSVLLETVTREADNSFLKDAFVSVPSVDPILYRAEFEQHFFSDESISSVMLVSLQRKVLFSFDADSHDKDAIDQKVFFTAAFAQAFDLAEATLSPAVSDLVFFPADKGSRLIIIVPVFADRALCGYVVAVLSPLRHMQSALMAEGVSKTGEVVFAQRQGSKFSFIAPTRFDSSAMFRVNGVMGSSRALLMQKVLNASRGMGSHTDYRGVKVYACWEYLPLLRWGMVVKVDRSELFSALNALLSLYAVMAVVLLLAVIFGAYVVARRIFEPIRDVRDGLRVIGKGNLDYRIPVTRADEIGELANDVNTMTHDLRTTLTSRDELEEARHELEVQNTALQEVDVLKNEFVSTVSHELRTPLASIYTSIDLVRDGSTGPVAPEQKEFLDLAMVSVERLVRLIGEILDYQKLGAGKMVFDLQRCDLADLVREAAALFRLSLAGKGLRLDLSLPGEPVYVLIERDKIAQVIANLMSNAMKFTQEGAITLGLELRSGGHVRVWVKDSGPGIDENNIARLFSPFVQLKNAVPGQSKGTGLGLALCKKIVEAHGGTIGVESALGKGSTFFFDLPLS